MAYLNFPTGVRAMYRWTSRNWTIKAFGNEVAEHDHQKLDHAKTDHARMVPIESIGDSGLDLLPPSDSINGNEGAANGSTFFEIRSTFSEKHRSNDDGRD